MDVKKVYKEYDKSVQTYMRNLIKRLESQYGQINDEWRVSLDLIALNYDIIVRCKDDILANGFEKYDDRGRLSRNPSITTLNQAQTNLMKLLSSFGLNIMSQSKIKNIDNEDDGLDALLD